MVSNQGGSELMIKKELSSWPGTICQWGIALPIDGSTLISFRVMRRLLALIWLSLSLTLASAPALAFPSPDCPKAQSSKMASSPMASDHEGMTKGHDGMDCCAENCLSNCVAVCSGTMMPPAAATIEPAKPMMAQLAARPPTLLKSIALAGNDPPPRIIFS